MVNKFLSSVNLSAVSSFMSGHLCSAAPLSGHRCVLCVVHYLIVTVFCETCSVSLYSTHLLERQNLDERIARDVVKFFSVQSTVTWVESLCAVVCSVRGSRECCEQKTVLSNNKLNTVQYVHLHNICSNQNCGPEFII